MLVIFGGEHTTCSGLAIIIIIIISIIIIIIPNIFSLLDPQVQSRT